MHLPSMLRHVPPTCLHDMIWCASIGCSAHVQSHLAKALLSVVKIQASHIYSFGPGDFHTEVLEVRQELSLINEEHLLAMNQGIQVIISLTRALKSRPVCYSAAMHPSSVCVVTL